MKKVLLYLVPAVALLAIVIVVMVYNKPHRSVHQEDAAFALSAYELVEAFSKNETEAERRYVGKVIQVEGPVTEMIRNDNTVVLRIGDSTAMIGVSCYLSNEEAMASAEIHKGESVTVKGICNGMLLDIVLDNGILLAHEQQ